MNDEIMYSLRKAIESNVADVTKAQIITASTKWADLVLPFTTIEYLQENPQLVAAGRTSYLDTYRYQVGVFARDINELLRLEEQIRTVLRERYGHPLFTYDEVTGTYVDSGLTVLFDDNGFTPIENDDTSEQTYDYHGYFDVSVTEF